MFTTAIVLLALGQLPQDALTEPLDVTETCWQFGAPTGFSTGFSGFGNFGGSYRTRSYSFNEEEFGATPAFGSGFGFGGGIGVPYQSGFSMGLGYDFGPRFASGFAPGFGYGYGFSSPRIKIKNKIKFHGRRW